MKIFSQVPSKITTDMIDTTTLDFYNANKNCTWTIQSIPPDLITNVEKASWILNESDFGWIQLDLGINIAEWQAEALSATPWLVPHRESNNSGWNSVCLHGIDCSYTGAWTNYGYTDETKVPYNWTSLSANTPTVKNFWQSEFPSDNYRRIRFMEVTGNSAITPHSDMPGKLPGEENFNALEFGIPINIAVAHPVDCHMVLEGYGVVPFVEGRAFIVNIRKYHSVLNFSNSPRMHVIGHSYGYGNKLQEFAELVVRSYVKQFNNSTG